MQLLKSITIFLLVAAFLFYEMGVQVSPGVITQDLMRDLNTTALGLSWISGIYFVTYTILQIPAGLIYDRVSVRQAVVIPIMLCALGAYALAMSYTIQMALLARLLMGFGSAFAFIAVLVVANDLFPAKYFALIAGITQLLAAFGALCGELPIVWSVQAVGWRQTMFIIGMAGFILAGLVFLFVRYPKKISQQTSDQQKVIKSLKTICKNNQTWFIAVYACLLWAPMATFASLWGVPFVKTAKHLSQENAASIVSLMWIGIAIGSPLLGLISDKIGRRKAPLIASALLGAISMGLIIFTSNQLSENMIRICLFLSGAACSGQVLSFAVIKENNIYENHAAAIGFNNMGVVLAGFIFQPLAGKLIQNHWDGISLDGVPYYHIGDYRAGLMIMPLCYLIAVIIALFAIRETYCQNQ